MALSVSRQVANFDDEPDGCPLLVASPPALPALPANWMALRVGTWHSQLVGRRKTELVEDVLAKFYHGRNVFTWAGTPAVREPDGTHGGERSISKAHALSAPIERITRRANCSPRCRLAVIAFIAYFGQRAAEPFEAFHSVHAEVIAG